MLKELEQRVKELDGIHLVIGDKYTSYTEPGYIDEFYINSVNTTEIELYYNKKTYKYNNFDEMINDKIFNNKSIKEISDIIHLDN
ncbi:MAG: hypothetical protein IKI04_01680 [Bacilli bacterium]|nr:hypothetical protein [Bacilli bacterium]